jgi:hypothetical protein
MLKTILKETVEFYLVLLSRAIALPLLWIGVRSVLQRQRARA